MLFRESDNIAYATSNPLSFALVTVASKGMDRSGLPSAEVRDGFNRMGECSKVGELVSKTDWIGSIPIACVNLTEKVML